MIEASHFLNGNFIIVKNFIFMLGYVSFCCYGFYKVMHGWLMWFFGYPPQISSPYPISVYFITLVMFTVFIKQMA